MTRLSDKQNNALHLYFRRLANALNDAGLDVQHVLEHKAVSIPWNEHLCKQILWKPIQEAMTGKESTQELTRVEPGDVYMVLDRHISELFGVHVEFPSEDEHE